MKAFPSPIHEREVIGKCFNEGMDLRDYFAAKAMQGLVTEGKCATRHEIANLSYAIADAMMEARKK